MIKTDVLIIGAGLSGLTVAAGLKTAGREFHLTEARSRIGGRIQSLGVSQSANMDANEMSPNEAASAFDLGPSWFWPDQNHLRHLIDSLDMQSAVFEQASVGNSTMEYANGNIDTSTRGASMEGAYRLTGGMASLTRCLSGKIPADKLSLGLSITEINSKQKTLCVSATNTVKQTTEDIYCQRVVLALPPRLVEQDIHFNPPLEPSETRLMSSVPTWMASQAKFVASYETAFWNKQGLSGDAFSQLGPLVEIHDASDRAQSGTSANAALFGFVGVPQQNRIGHDEALKKAALLQLQRLFGQLAANPVAVFFKDWAHDPRTAAQLDLQQPAAHARLTVGPTLLADSRIIWAGSETATTGAHSNGFLEGAVESAVRALKILTTE